MDVGAVLLGVGILLLVGSGYQPALAYVGTLEGVHDDVRKLVVAEGFVLTTVGFVTMVRWWEPKCSEVIRRIAVMTRESAVSWLVVGAIVAMIGVLLFLAQGSTVSECQTFLGQLGRALSPEVQQRCSTANLLRTISGVGAVGGLIVALVGIVSLAASPRDKA